MVELAKIPKKLMKKSPCQETRKNWWKTSFAGGIVF